MIRAKMRCDLAKMESWGEQIKLQAVYSTDTTDPNHSWSQATPAGYLDLTISNPGAQGKFEVGKEYYIDIAPA